MRDNYRTYSNKQIKEALKEADDPSAQKLRELSDKYKVPLSTLKDHAKSPDMKYRSGPSSYLSNFEEECLVHWIEEMRSFGIHIKSSDVQEKARKIYKARIEAAKENMIEYVSPKFGRKWFKLFKNRHNLCMRKAEKLDKKRKALSEEDIGSFFANVEEICVKYNIYQQRIYNADEVGIALSPTPPKVLAKKGKDVLICASEKKGQVTIMMTINSCGTYLPPLLIYKGKTMNEEQSEYVPDGWIVTANNSAFITGPIFAQWLQKLGKTIEVSKQNPALLILDPHRSREDINALEWARENGFQIICFPGGATHLMQPLDVALFKPFKSKYAEEMFKIHEVNGDLKIYSGAPSWPQILPHIQTAINHCFTEEAIKKSFECCGIVPFDPAKVIKRLEGKSRPPELSNDQLKEIFTTNIINIEKPKIKNKRISIANTVVTKEEIVSLLQQRKEQQKEKESNKKRKSAPDTEQTTKNKRNNNNIPTIKPVTNTASLMPGKYFNINSITINLAPIIEVIKETNKFEMSLDEITLEKFERRLAEGYDLHRKEDDTYWAWVESKRQNSLTKMPNSRTAADIEVAQCLQLFSSSFVC